MTLPKFIQIHFLTSYAAALLNRDDSGMAKRLPYGPIGRFVRRTTLKKNFQRTQSGSPVSGWSDVQRPRNFAVGGPGMPIEVA